MVKTVTLSIDDELYRDLKDAAAFDRRSLESYIVYLLLKAMTPPGRGGRQGSAEG